MQIRLIRVLLPMLTVIGSLALADSASATTFCVPGFTATCPNSGGNVAQASLQTAVNTNNTDAAADTVILTAPVVSEPAAVSASGTDSLTIRGAGPSSSTITSTSTSGPVISVNAAAITLKDLKVVAPASFPDGSGTTVNSAGATLENVAVVSQNAGTSGVGGSGTYRNVSVGTESGGSIISAFAPINNSAVPTTIEDSSIQGANFGLYVSGNATVTAKRLRMTGIGTVAVTVLSGSLSLENALIDAGGDKLFRAAAVGGSTGASIVADHVTGIRTGTGPAIEASVGSGQTGNASVSVTNSILRGGTDGWIRNSAGTGAATVSVSYSNLTQTGTSTGPGNLTVMNSQTADPLFTSATDRTLLSGSPSIDAGNPAGANPATDLAGGSRVLDGNSDGVAITDQGAFEAPTGTTPAPKDTTAPDTRIDSGPGSKTAKGKAKFAFSSTEFGSTFKCKLDKGSFAPCTSPASFKKLKKGKHTFAVVATDAAGNADPSPATAKFKVKPKKPKR